MWDEQFTFWVDEFKDSLVVSGMDEDKFFNYDYVGQLKVPIALVFEEEIKSFGIACFSNMSSPAKEETASSSSKEKKSCVNKKSFAGRIVQILNKCTVVASRSPSRSIDSDQSETSKVEVGDLNTLLFSPDSNFPKALADLQGTTELQVGPWKSENGGESSKISFTYLKAAIKLVKAVKGYEDQTYLKADGKNLAVLASVSTPDDLGSSKEQALATLRAEPQSLQYLANFKVFLNILNGKVRVVHMLLASPSGIQGLEFNRFYWGICCMCYLGSSR
ncbi:hypothetical protein VNO80_19455 [Phaseolus coccineus]|uniref:VASt domain-containing protein n=1 Tax=Phaseolus coccineus TaxID=3886 RepID=A0AAN9MG65_PHACN